MFLLTLFLFSLFAGSASSVATAIAGLITPFVVQVIKRTSGASGKAALFLTLAVSLAVTVAALAFTGGFSAANLPVSVAGAFGIASAIFRIFLKAEGIELSE